MYFTFNLYFSLWLGYTVWVKCKHFIFERQVLVHLCPHAFLPAYHLKREVSTFLIKNYCIKWSGIQQNWGMEISGKRQEPALRIGKKPKANLLHMKQVFVHWLICLQRFPTYSILPAQEVCHLSCVELVACIATFEWWEGCAH